MVILLFILFLIMSIAGYLSSRNLFAPYFLMAISWTVVLFLYLVVDHGMFDINSKFPLQLLVWGLCFFISSFVSEKLTASSAWEKHVWNPNEKLLNLYTVLFTISVLIISYKTISLALQYGQIFFYLRVINVGYDDELKLDFGLFNNFAILGIIVYLIELERYSAKNKGKVIFLLIMNLLFFLTTMAKINFLALTISSIFILYLKEKINIRKIFLVVLIFGVFAVILQYLRSLERNDIDILNFLSVYIVSGSVAFDQISFAPPEHFGENTFRLFYAIKHAFGSAVAPINTVLDFSYVGQYTNTYTTLYPFYLDFKTIGVMIFAILTGSIFGFISKKAITGGLPQTIQYAYFSVYIILQFIGDFFFTNFSFTLQLLFYAALPFMFSLKQDYGKN